MKIYTEDMENQMVTLSYKEPSLKKYGTIRQLTKAFNGSGGDAIGGIPDDGIHCKIGWGEIGCEGDSD